MSKNFSRRTILRGFGGAFIGLPLLESLNNTAFAQTQKVAKRFILFFEHGGTVSNVGKSGSRYDGTGNNSGANGWDSLDPASEAFVPGPIHDVLSSSLDYLLLLRGMNGPGWLGAPYNGN